MSRGRGDTFMKIAGQTKDVRTTFLGITIIRKKVDGASRQGAYMEYRGARIGHVSHGTTRASCFRLIPNAHDEAEGVG